MHHDFKSKITLNKKTSIYSFRTQPQSTNLQNVESFVSREFNNQFNLLFHKSSPVAHYYLFQQTFQNRPVFGAEIGKIGFNGVTMENRVEKAKELLRQVSLFARDTVGMDFIFAWDVDFSKDLRKGDSFHVIYDGKYRKNETIKDGVIIAAELIIGGQSLQAYRYVDDDGSGDTVCPSCGQTVIRRQGLKFIDTELTGNRCDYCRYEIAGVELGPSDS